jgi:hypothetical protein
MDLITKKNQLISEIEKNCSSLIEGVEYEFTYPYEMDDMKNLLFGFEIEFNKRWESIQVYLLNENLETGKPNPNPIMLADLSLSELEDVNSRIRFNYFSGFGA